MNIANSIRLLPWLISVTLATGGCGGDEPIMNNDLGCAMECPVGQVCMGGTCVAQGCRGLLECDDHFTCTVDTCAPESRCTHTIGPNVGPTACPAGQFCTLDKGCIAAPPCATTDQCEKLWESDACKATRTATSTISCPTAGASPPRPIHLREHLARGPTTDGYAARVARATPARSASTTSASASPPVAVAGRAGTTTAEDRVAPVPITAPR